jgi:hypothetical protein
VLIKRLGLDEAEVQESPALAPLVLLSIYNQQLAKKKSTNLFFFWMNKSTNLVHIDLKRKQQNYQQIDNTL